MKKISDTKINISIKSITSLILCLVGGFLSLYQSFIVSAELKESGEMMSETIGIPFIIFSILTIIGSIIAMVFKKGGSILCIILSIPILIFSYLLLNVIAFVAFLLLLIGGITGYIGSRRE